MLESADTHSRHCLWLMLVVSLAHSMSGVAVAGHSLTPSSPALASRCPSGLNATLVHRAGVAGEGVADGLAGVGVPQPHRAVGAGAGQPVPVGAERHTRHRGRCGR